MTAAPEGAAGFKIHLVGDKECCTWRGSGLRRASENRDHVSGQQWSDGDQAAANHGGVAFKVRPDYYVGTVPCFVVRTRNKIGVGIHTCGVEGADVVTDYVLQTDHAGYTCTT